MASEYERRAWAMLGPSLGQAFQSWGQERQRRVEFDAQMAMAELQRRDAKEAQQEQIAINRRILEMNEEKAALDLKRYEEDQEQQAELLELLGGYAIGAPNIREAGEIAAQEWMGGIQEAEGGLQKMRAFVAGLAPAMAKGAAETTRTPYKTLTEYVQKQGLSRDEAGLLVNALGVEAFMPEDVDYNQMKAAFDMSIAYGLDLPAEFQAMPGVVEAIEKGCESYAKAQTDAEKMNAINIATAEANLKYAEWKAEHPGYTGRGVAPLTGEEKQRSDYLIAVQTITAAEDAGLPPPQWAVDIVEAQSTGEFKRGLSPEATAQWDTALQTIYDEIRPIDEEIAKIKDVDVLQGKLNRLGQERREAIEFKAPQYVFDRIDEWLAMVNRAYTFRQSELEGLEKEGFVVKPHDPTKAGLYGG